MEEIFKMTTEKEKKKRLNNSKAEIVSAYKYMRTMLWKTLKKKQ